MLCVRIFKTLEMTEFSINKNLFQDKKITYPVFVPPLAEPVLLQMIETMKKNHPKLNSKFIITFFYSTINKINHTRTYNKIHNNIEIRPICVFRVTDKNRNSSRERSCF